MNKLSIILFFTYIFATYLVIANSWINWCTNQQCSPVEIYYPKDLHELRSTLYNIVQCNYTVRVIGAGHSASDIVNTHDCLINLQHLNKILALDQQKKLIKVEAGITLHELNKYLANNGLALSNQPAINQLSLGGAVSTATHGTGHTGSLSSFITAIDLLTADGTLHTINAQSDPQGFAAAQVSLGALGILYAITIQCEPIFTLIANNYQISLEEFITSYQNLYNNNDFFQGLWNTKTNMVLINIWNRTKTPYVNLLQEESVDCHKALCWYTIDNNHKSMFSEISVPLERLPQALKIFQEIIAQYTIQGLTINDIVSIRFVQPDLGSWLSPCSNRAVASISISTPVQKKFMPLYKDLEEALYPLEGRPHWGKINFLEYERVLQLYGNQIIEFNTARRRFDPQGTFSNDFVKRICGDK